MQLKEITKQLIKSHNDLRSGRLDAQGTVDTITNINSYNNYLNSQVIASTIESLMTDKYPSESKDYVIAVGETDDGEMISHDTLLVKGTRRETSLLQDKYIHIPNNTQSLMVELRRGNMLVRINYTYNLDGQGQGQTLMYNIYEPIGSNDLYAPSPMGINSNELRGTYIYPKLNEDGSISLLSSTTEGGQ